LWKYARIPDLGNGVTGVKSSPSSPRPLCSCANNSPPGSTGKGTCWALIRSRRGDEERCSCSGRKSNPSRPIVQAQKANKMSGKSRILSLSDPSRRSLPALIAWNLEDTASSQQPNRSTDTSVSARSDFSRHTSAASRVLYGVQSEQKGQLR
jgi:hypothetical protein